MTSTLLIVQIVLALSITIVVLLQKSSSIGLGAYSGSNESVFGAKGPTGFLAKLTFTLAFLFIVNTLTLGYLYTTAHSSSIADTIPLNNKTVPASPEKKETTPIAPPAPSAPTIEAKTTVTPPAPVVVEKKVTVVEPTKTEEVVKKEEVVKETPTNVIDPSKREATKEDTPPTPVIDPTKTELKEDNTTTTN